MPKTSGASTIRAILFDFDGTLTRPESLDFPAFKEAIGCPPHQPVLEFIAKLPSRREQKDALRVLDDFEFDAAAFSKPNSGAEELISYLRSRKLPMGIISRNSLRSIRRSFQSFTSLSVSDFEVIISRDDDIPPKPDPAGVRLAAEKLGVATKQTLVVGDFVFDIDSGQKAGAPTVFLTNGCPFAPFAHPPNYIIKNLGELKSIVQSLQPLAAGKLPNDLLHQLLNEYPLDDPSVRVPPGVGEDTAVVQLEGQDEMIVLKSDPITFTTDQLGYYAVVVNANDVATSGAVPRWLLTTLLFPTETNAAQIHYLVQELQQACRQLGVSLCGGHTEITSAVNKPIVVGQLVGTVPKDRLIDKHQMEEGNQILLTKGIAVEGTSILARELPKELEALGLSESKIEQCQQFLFDPGISILREAEIAASSREVTAMHDVTEGGLATAIEELSAAGRHRIRVYWSQIPVLSETREICKLLGLDPLGLIGSGSLLIACRREACERLITAIHEAGIPVSRIGEVLGVGFGVEALGQKGQCVEWPRFRADELTRVATDH